MWYFFSRRGSNGDRQNRKTSSGFWKITGDPVEVKDQWGTWCGVKGKIGYKRVLVFRRGKSSSSQSTKSDWVMHEYHYTLLPQDQVILFIHITLVRSRYYAIILIFGIFFTHRGPTSYADWSIRART